MGNKNADDELPAMNADQQRIYDQTPAAEPRSRLEKHKELILHWRRDGRSYQAIRELLASNYNVTVGTTMLHKFVQTRSRPGKTEGEQLARAATENRQE